MYKFRQEGKKIPIRVNSNLSLYDACKKAIGVNGGIVIDRNKLIAFYCSHDKSIKSGFGSNDYEKCCIENYKMEAK